MSGRVQKETKNVNFQGVYELEGKSLNIHIRVSFYFMRILFSLICGSEVSYLVH